MMELTPAADAVAAPAAAAPDAPAGPLAVLASCDE